MSSLCGHKEDKGSSVPKDKIKHIFEPFIRQRERKGTGLGLSISYGIMQRLVGQSLLKAKSAKEPPFL
jgi:two-component system NtrC family sensor kinase